MYDCMHIVEVRYKVIECIFLIFMAAMNGGGYLNIP